MSVSMSTNRLIIATIFVFGAAAVAFFMMKNQPQETTAPITDHTPTDISSPSTNPVGTAPSVPKADPKPIAPKVIERIAAMSDRRPEMNFSPEEVAEAIEQDRAWSTDDNPDLAERFELDDEDRYDGRKFVALNTLKIESLQPGDVMEIPIPQEAERFEMTVTEVVDNYDGTVTWRGEVNGYDSQNQVTITKDKYNTYFSMFTPDLNYVVHGKGDAAYVVDSGTLFKVPEGSETDVVYPDDYDGPRDE